MYVPNVEDSLLTFSVRELKCTQEVFYITKRLPAKKRAVRHLPTSLSNLNGQSGERGRAVHEDCYCKLEAEAQAADPSANQKRIGPA